MLMQFTPAWWLNNRHLQTIFPALFRRPPRLVSCRERLPTPDGDLLDLDYVGGAEQPLVILLHGLTGSSRSSYIIGLQAALQKHGFSSVALNFRGCSGVSNNTSRCYHSGETGDIDFVYRTMRDRYPHRPLAVTGFSLGGNVLLKWLGEQGADLHLFAAVAVSVPLLLDQCASYMDRGFSKIYRDRLLEDLKHYLNDKHKHLQQNGMAAEAEKIETLGNLANVRSFWQYDEQVVAKLYGFRDAHDYYRKSSSRQYLKAIRVHSLIIQAANDPFMPRSVLPTSAELSDCIQLEITRSGGHVGFVAGANPFKPIYWLEMRIPAFLKAQLAGLQRQ